MFNTPPDVGDIGHSLRFRGSQYLSRTLPASLGATKSAMSVWIKRGKLGAYQSIFVLGGDINNYGELYFNTTDALVLIANTGGVTILQKASTALFRDTSAWLHIVCLVDTTLATAEDRFQLWVNGVRLTSFSTNTNTWVQNTTFYFGVGVTKPTWICANYSTYNECYLARFAFVYQPTSMPTVADFGYFNTDINEWVSNSQSAVKAVVDAGGTNSFMLDFDNGTSTTTLGYDKSSKGNNWTCNNISLTAGATYDWMLDVPGNSYATLNSLIPSAANITNGNLSSGTTAARGAFNCTAIDSQWFVTAGASAVTAGVIDDSGATNTTTVTANKVFAFKMTTAGALSYKNVTDAGSWTSIATGLTGNRWPYSVTQAASWNFGQQPLPEALDTGFRALNQANLSASGTVIVSGSFTGNASTDGPFIWMNGVPDTLTINGNAVTFGTHADKLANGFKLRTSSASYNVAGSNTWTATITSDTKNIFKYNTSEGNP